MEPVAGSNSYPVIPLPSFNDPRCTGRFSQVDGYIGGGAEVRWPSRRDGQE